VLFEGLIGLSVQDNDVVGRLDAILQQFRTKLAELSSIQGIEVGQGLFGSVEAGAEGATAVLGQLKTTMLELNAVGRNLNVGGASEASLAEVRALIAGNEQLIAITGELGVFQKEQAVVAQVSAAAQVAANREVAASVAEAAAARPVVPTAQARFAEAAAAAGFSPGAPISFGGQTIGTVGTPGREAAVEKSIDVEIAGHEHLATVLEEVAAVQTVGSTKEEAASAKLVASRAREDVAINERIFKSEAQATAALAGAQGSTASADLSLARARIAQSAESGTDLSGVNPLASYRVQQLQTAVATTTSMEQTLLAERAGTISAVELNAARLKVLEAEGRLLAQTEREGVAANGGGGGGGGISALSAVKYFALYQAFGVGIQMLGQLKTSTEDYSLAVNQLSIALDTSYNQAQQVAQGYAQIGQSLATAPGVAVNAAAQYTRFFQDQSGASGNVAARLGSTVNLLESRTANPGQEEALVQKRLDELGAIAQNYGLGAQGAADLYSSATIIAQQYGQAHGGALLGGTAQIADLLKQSGFDPNQGLALVGAVSQYTGATSEAAAGDLKRLLGRSGSNTFQSLFSQYGVNTNQNVKGELAQLSIKFADLDSTQQDSIITKLGGGRAGAAALALIKNFSQIDATAQKGADSPNAAADQAQKRLDTFAGQVEQIRTDMVNLATDLGQSGLTGIFGLLLRSIDPIIRGLEAMVKGFNAVPAAISGPVVAAGVVVAALVKQEAAIGILNKIGRVKPEAAVDPEVGSKEAATAATKEHTAALTENAAASTRAAAALAGETVKEDAAGIARVEAATAAVAAAQAQKDAAPGALSLAIATRQLAVAQEEELAATEALAAGTTAAATATGEAAAANTGAAVTQTATGVRALGAASLAALEPLALIAAAIGAVMLAGEVKKRVDLQNTGRDEANAGYAAGQSGVQSGSIAGIKAGIGGLDQGTKDINASIEGFWGQFQLGLGGIGDVLTGNSVDTSALRLKTRLDTIAAQKASLEESLKGIEKSLAEAGGNAPGSVYFGKTYDNIDQGVRAMEANRLSAGESAKQLSELFSHTTTDAQLNQEFTPVAGNKGVTDELKRLITQASRSTNPLDAQAQLQALTPLVKQLQAFAARSGDPTVYNAILDIIDQINKPYFQGIVTLVQARIASIKSFEGTGAKGLSDIRAVLRTGIEQAALGGDVTAVQTLSALGDVSFLNSITAKVKAQIQIAKAKDIALAKAAVIAADAAPAFLAGLPGGLGGEHNLPAATTDAPNTAGLKKTLGAAISRGNTIRSDIASAQADLASTQSVLISGDQEWLKNYLASKEVELNVADAQAAAIRTAIASANAGYADHFTRIADAHTPTGASDPATVTANAASAAARANLLALEREANTLAQARGISAPSGSAFQAAKTKGPTGPTPAQIEEARLAAEAIPGDPLSAAVTNLKVAQYKMSEPKNQVEYWQAVKALHEAQYAYSVAQLTSQNDALQLGQDLTNPLIVARDKVAEARRQLVFDKGRGALSDVTNKDQLALKQAVSSAEKTAFDQKFSDEQTNFNLQRISLQAYLSYLNSQHNYLTAVHSRTRQQTEELNQVDQALQGLANSLQGQFNLGQIKVPTPYEARRIVAGGGGPVSNVQITINGADIVAVKGIISQYIGQGAMATAGSNVRKV